MRLFHRKPREAPQVYISSTQLLYLGDLIYNVKTEMHALREDMSKYAQEVTQIGKYLAELERERNAKQAASNWQALEDGTEKREPESQEERLIRLRAKYGKMLERRNSGERDGGQAG